ncbi:hypothetical protein UFOVP26_111 [uncultured Caudovirales phage]|uniref:Uncharacterized protein n=1 Tax=uncultured Caudovirales phage TaxID=2100421 RepID=A0A6J5KPR1_9CAUD|nr:hypothetical protein UFOVP26_111 [uncultured Caudovirales phage]CAB4124010.1 hypothetical protein UFOVP44_124 [uncultured Caudovirales phage]CAB5219647.1 hypothetical protein UFOVP220_115 [uncultured Caudovirales phage]
MLVFVDRAKETTSTTGTGTLTLTGAVAGYLTFANVFNGNTTYYVIESGNDWEIGLGTYSSTGPSISRDLVQYSSNANAKISVAAGATVFSDVPASIINSLMNSLNYAPGGPSGSIQFNQSGIPGGVSQLMLNYHQLAVATDDGHSTPPANYVTLLGSQAGGRAMMGQVDTESEVYQFQPWLARNQIAFTKGICGASTLTSMGMSLTATGTATAATWAATNLHTSMNRFSNRATTASTTAVAGFRGSVATYFRGANTGLGGFTYVCRFGIGTSTTAPTLTTCRAFVGLRASTAAPTDVSPATLTNAIGIGWEATDTNVQFYAAGTAMVKTDTGIPLTRTPEANQVFEVVISCPPGASYINIDVVELVAGYAGFQQVTLSTSLPTTTTGLNVYGYMSAGGTSSTMSIDVMSLYVESFN